MDEGTDQKKGIEAYNIVRIRTLCEIRNLVYDFDHIFIPSLSQRLSDLDGYAEKLYNNAIIYAAVEDDKNIGFLAFYANDENTRICYLTQIAVKVEAQNRKIGKALLNLCINISKNIGMNELKLEAINSNSKSINFYKKNGFKFSNNASKESIYMIKKLN